MQQLLVLHWNYSSQKQREYLVFLNYQRIPLLHQYVQFPDTSFHLNQYNMLYTIVETPSSLTIYTILTFFIYFHIVYLRSFSTFDSLENALAVPNSLSKYIRIYWENCAKTAQFSHKTVSNAA